MPPSTPQRFHLEEKAVRRLAPPESGNRIYYDDLLPGFGLRVTQAGARAFVLNYYAASGRERRLTIGKWPTWSATAAREEARELRRRIDRGEDPLETKREARLAETFGELAAEYLERYASQKRTGDQDKRYLEADVLPAWRSLKVREIERRDVIRLIEAKAQTAPISANRLLALLRKLFNWAVERDLVAVNPCLQVRAPGKETSKDRVLSVDEVGVFWAGFVPGPELSAEVVAALRLILATAQRPGEVVGMEWSEVDLDAAWWTIPAEKAKNGLAHRVPLNPVAVDLLRERRATVEDGVRWVFPSPRAGQAIGTGALAHALRRNRNLEEDDARRVPLAEFTPHDLRRSAASHMASNGVSRLVVGQVLNHVERSVTRVYDRHGYDAEKRAAMETWGRVLGKAIGKPQKAAVVEIA